jgi:membrane protease YdiL (CAAX protease family)
VKSGNWPDRHVVRNLVIFVFLVIALGWIGKGLDTLMGATAESPGIGFFLWLIAPLTASFLLRAFAGDGWKDLGIRPAFKGNGLWYAASILAYPVSTAFILLIGSALGAVSFPQSTSASLMVLVQGIAISFVPWFVKNIFEEFGWRGYLAPKMYGLPIQIFVGHALVGIIWASWHLPYLSAIQGPSAQNMLTLIPFFYLGCMAHSIVYGEIRLATSSVWPAVLMHTVGSALLNTLVLQGVMVQATGMEFLVSPGVEGLLGSVFFVLAGIGLHLWRKKQRIGA